MVNVVDIINKVQDFSRVHGFAVRQKPIIFLRIITLNTLVLFRVVLSRRVSKKVMQHKDRLDSDPNYQADYKQVINLHLIYVSTVEPFGMLIQIEI